VNAQNILVLDFGQLGDVVLSLPALAAIRKRFPEARITVMGGSAAALVVEMTGSANRTVAIDRVALRDGPKWESIRAMLRIVSDVRRAHYDLAIDLHSLSESNLLAWLSGAPERVFAERQERSLGLLATRRTPWEDREKHRVDRYLDVLAPLGITGAPRIPQLPTRHQDDELMERTLREHGVTADARLVGMFPGASQPNRRWALERFAEVAARLEKQDGARIVVFLGPEEAPVAAEMRAAFSSAAIVLDRLTLSQVASAAARLRLLISNDSGPMHLAAAVGTPVVLLLGAPVRGPYWFGPVGERHRILLRSRLTDISAREVYEMAREMLREEKSAVHSAVG
jgi:ADP-heptose:LPS heptosyltransferase